MTPSSDRQCRKSISGRFQTSTAWRRRFQRGKASLEDVVRAYQVIIRLPGFIGTLEGVMDELYRDAA